ncbi:hypothetical protein Dimus_008456 [Dionaea muscipula]
MSNQEVGVHLNSCSPSPPCKTATHFLLHPTRRPMQGATNAYHRLQQRSAHAQQQQSTVQLFNIAAYIQTSSEASKPITKAIALQRTTAKEPPTIMQQPSAIKPMKPLSSPNEQAHHYAAPSSSAALIIICSSSRSARGGFQLEPIISQSQSPPCTALTQQLQPTRSSIVACNSGSSTCSSSCSVKSPTAAALSGP